MLPRRSANKQKIWELNHFSQAVQLNAATTALAFAAVPTGSGGSVGELGGGEGQEGLRDGEGMACLMLPGSYGELVFSHASPGVGLLWVLRISSSCPREAKKPG